jgi:hypothetical protein
MTPLKKLASFLIITLLVLVVAGIFIYVNRTELYTEMNRLDLVPKPEALTELYFNDYAELPKTTVANQPISFSFTIHNLEGATTTYPYTVSFVYPDGTNNVFASSSVAIPNNGSDSVTIDYVFPQSNLTGSVVVNLTNLNQQIDFIVPNTNP